MGFEAFCGSEFWNSSLTWNTGDPDFTDCFHKSVLAWTPVAVLACLAPYDVKTCLSSKSRDIKFNYFNLLKLFLTLTCAVVCLVDLIMMISSDRSRPDIDYVTVCVLLLGYLGSLALLLLTLKYGVR